MSSTNQEFILVSEFNRSVLGLAARLPGLQDEDEKALSIHQLLEEASEFSKANAEHDLVGAVDAIMDGIYFGYGILYKLGLDESQVTAIFAHIHEKNMEKAKGVKSGREGYDSEDAVKPEDWVGPEERIAELLGL